MAIGEITSHVVHVYDKFSIMPSILHFVYPC